MGEGGLPGSGVLALLLWAVNSFLWDAAVSSREAAKGKARRREVSRLSGFTCDTPNHQPQASMKGGLQDWIESFHSLLSLVLFPMCLREGQTLFQLKSLCVHFVWLMIQRFLFFKKKHEQLLWNLTVSILKGLKFPQLSIFIKAVNPT